MGQNKCFIKVSDPWNFESPDGENIIKGSILSKGVINVLFLEVIIVCNLMELKVLF